MLPDHGTRPSTVDYPFFFEPSHGDLAARASRIADRLDPLDAAGDRDAEAAGREAVRILAEEDLLRWCVPPRWSGRPHGTPERLDTRALCVLREEVARASGIADAMVALQALGSYPLVLAAPESLRSSVLPAIAEGRRIAAFAMTEPGAGSDAAAISTRARRDGNDWILDGTKVFISNAGLADAYVVFARTSDDGAKGLSAFFVEPGGRGSMKTEPTPLLAPHPLGSIRFDGYRVPAAHLLGREGEGLKIALTTLDVCRATVGAAANGFGRRALAEAIERTRGRIQFGRPLAEEPGVQAMLAEMATQLDAARLIVLRAAWAKDQGQERITREAAEAKLFATEAAQRIVDAAVQLHGGLGVVRGNVVERLYREVRMLRIYEGASEVQRLVIGRGLARGPASA